MELIDFGKRRTANICDIGHLIDKRLQLFPIQITNLCLLELVPSNGQNWNNEDTDFIKGLIFQNNFDDKVFGNGIFEIQIENEINSNICKTICALNIFSHNLKTGKCEDYAELLISTRIAVRNTDATEQFLKHTMETNSLMKHF